MRIFLRSSRRGMERSGGVRIKSVLTKRQGTVPVPLSVDVLLERFKRKIAPAYHAMI
jgi:hypothetical protein